MDVAMSSTHAVSGTASGSPQVLGPETDNAHITSASISPLASQASSLQIPPFLHRYEFEFHGVSAQAARQLSITSFFSHAAPSL